MSPKSKMLGQRINSRKPPTTPNAAASNVWNPFCVFSFFPSTIDQTKFYLSTNIGWVEKGGIFRCVEEEERIIAAKSTRTWHSDVQSTNQKYVMTMRCMAMTRENDFLEKVCAMTEKHFASVKSWEANWQHVQLKKRSLRCEQWYVNTKNTFIAVTNEEGRTSGLIRRHFYMQIWCSIHFVFDVRQTTISTAQHHHQ